MSKILIYSTLTQSNEYALWEKGGGELKEKVASVTIKGGANLADKHFITPRGVVTAVTPEELKLLKNNRIFNLHVSRGFITIDENSKKEEIEKVVSDMTGRDMSAPLVPQDYELEGKKTPITNTEKKGNSQHSAKPKSSGKNFVPPIPAAPAVPTPPAE